MSDAKPVPVVRGEERTYFEEARRHRLVYQSCDECGAAIFYPRAVCPTCLSERLSVAVSRGAGVVYSFTTHYRPGHPSFGDDVPYTVVLVDLAEGVRVLADIVDCAPDEVAVGMPVRVVFDDVTGELTLPRFRPAAGSE
jgi:uncharacterized OB-fold protein